MAIAAIRDYLNSNLDWTEGVNLYLRFGDDLFLKSIIKNGYSKEIFKQLLEGLKEADSKRDDSIELLKKSDYKLPADLQELQNRVNDMYGQLRLVHATIDTMPSIAQRKNAANDIILNFRWIDEAYKSINHYKATGERMPDARVQEKEKTSYTLKELIDCLKLNRSNISKSKIKLSKATEPQRMNLLSAKIQVWEDELVLVGEIIEKNKDVVFEK